MSTWIEIQFFLKIDSALFPLSRFHKMFLSKSKFSSFWLHLSMLYNLNFAIQITYRWIHPRKIYNFLEIYRLRRADAPCLVCSYSFILYDCVYETFSQISATLLTYGQNIDKLFYKTNIDTTSSVFLIFQNAETVEKLNETGDLRQLLRPYKVPIICMLFD